LSHVHVNWSAHIAERGRKSQLAHGFEDLSVRAKNGGQAELFELALLSWDEIS